MENNLQNKCQQKHSLSIAKIFGCVTCMFLGTFSPSVPGMCVCVLGRGSSQKETSQRMKMTRAWRKLSLVQYNVSPPSCSLRTML